MKISWRRASGAAALLLIIIAVLNLHGQTQTLATSIAGLVLAVGAVARQQGLRRKLKAGDAEDEKMPLRYEAMTYVLLGVGLALGYIVYFVDEATPWRKGAVVVLAAVVLGASLVPSRRP